MKRLPVLAVLLVGALTAMLALPQSIVACTCAGSAPGDVEFVGTATDGPDRGWFDMFDGIPGVYTFTVDEVVRGDPGDGRVFTTQGYGGCGRTFDIGAQYMIHADVIGPGWVYMGESPDASLVTTTCLQGRQMKPAPEFFDSVGAAPVLGGLLLVGGALAGMVYRRRVSKSRG